VQHVKQPYQRFVPFNHQSGDFALDTKTGQLCKTWEWDLASAKPSKNGEPAKNGELRRDESIDSCATLYKTHPD
jgi:hypothetical protein